MSKRKGYTFELETAALAGKRGRRVPLSGSMGTSLGIDKLSGDAVWTFPWLDKTINLECKHGYSPEGGKAKSMVIKKEWFDKHMGQADASNFYPLFAMKFKFTAENGISKFIVIPFPVMAEILEGMENIWLELQELKNEQKEQRERKLH